MDYPLFSQFFYLPGSSMANTETSENTARHLLKDAAQGRDISEAYNNLPNEEKRAIFQVMNKMERGEIPGFPSSKLLLEGVDTDDDGTKDQLGSVYNKAKKTSVFRDRPDSVYSVYDGDTLNGIAEKSLNSCLAPDDSKGRADAGQIEKAAARIAKENELPAGAKLESGDELVIPGNLVAPGRYGDQQKMVKGMPLPTSNMGADSDRLVRTKEVLNSMPEPVLDLLKDSGVKVVVSHDLCHEEPSQAMDTPRGYGYGETAEQSPAEYDPDAKELRVRQNYKLHDGTTKVSSADDFADSVRHESGHAVDAALGEISHTKQFEDAYQKDVAALSQEQRDEFDYYLIGSENKEDLTGREETFAQAFAAGLKDEKLTSNPDDATHETDRNFLKAFPNVEKLVKEKLQDHLD